MRDCAVEEIRDRRRRLLQERYAGSIEKLLAASVTWQKNHPVKVMDLRKRHTVKVRASAA